jgi:biotin operon repressor
MSAVAINYGHHARVPAEMIAQVLKPRALQILNLLLTLCNPQKPEVWVSQSFIGKKLGIHRDTAGKWIRELEKQGRLSFIGLFKDGRHKKYKIVMHEQADENLTKPILIDKAVSKTTSGVFVGRPPVNSSDDLRRIHRNINRKELTEYKEQTVVDFSKKLFSSNERIALKQKLKLIGLNKLSMEKLLTRFSEDKIVAQIEHLQYAQKRGDVILQPASWLITAIEKNYSLPREIDKNAQEEEKKAEILREASKIAQQAKFKLDEGSLEHAKELAEQSIELAKTNMAMDVLKEAVAQQENAKKLEQAFQMVSKTQRDAIFQEEQEKKLREMSRWYKSDSSILESAFFRGAVEASVNQRLLALI